METSRTKPLTEKIVFFYMTLKVETRTTATCALAAIVCVKKTNDRCESKICGGPSSAQTTNLSFATHTPFDQPFWDLFEDH
jgi:hypothetical protein